MLTIPSMKSLTPDEAELIHNHRAERECSEERPKPIHERESVDEIELRKWCVEKAQSGMIIKSNNAFPAPHTSAEEMLTRARSIYDWINESK